MRWSNLPDMPPLEPPSEECDWNAAVEYAESFASGIEPDEVETQYGKVRIRDAYEGDGAVWVVVEANLGSGDLSAEDVKERAEGIVCEVLAKILTEMLESSYHVRKKTVSPSDVREVLEGGESGIPGVDDISISSIEYSIDRGKVKITAGFFIDPCFAEDQLRTEEYYTEQDFRYHERD